MKNTVSTWTPDVSIDQIFSVSKILGTHPFDNKFSLSPILLWYSCSTCVVYLGALGCAVLYIDLIYSASNLMERMLYFTQMTFMILGNIFIEFWLTRKLCLLKKIKNEVIEIQQK